MHLGFYHSDRPLTQQALARNLSYALVPTLPRATLQRFLRAFWITIGRDFHSLDRLRLDKYLFLIRCYVGIAFEVFVKGAKAQAQNEEMNKKRKRQDGGGKKEKNKRSKGKKNGRAQEDEEAENEDKESATGGDSSGDPKWADLESYLSMIEEGPLCPVNFDPDQPAADEKNDYVPMPHGPDGLRYHVMDIWIDELEKVLEFDEDEVDGEEEESKSRKPKGDVPMELLLRPIEKLRTDSPNKPVRKRATEALNDDRLVEWGFKSRPVQEEDEDEESEIEWGGFDD